MTSFDILIAEGYDPVASLLEIFASGEIGQWLIDFANHGVSKTICSQVSPACHFGLANSTGKLINKDIVEKGKRILNDIKSGKFFSQLNKEMHAGYPVTRAFDEIICSSELQKTYALVEKDFNIDM
jgi:ketol-acid reductoisomerase